MRSIPMIQYGIMIAVSFISGIICYQLFEVGQAVALLTDVDGRLLAAPPFSKTDTIVPVAVSLVVVLLFSTHPYLTSIALLFIALRCTFFGFSSVFLLTQQQAITLYTYWWFPFQLLYCILLVGIYKLLKSHHSAKPQAKTVIWYRALFIILLMIGAVVVEIIVISYI